MAEAIDRLRTRKRQTVPVRDASIVQSSEKDSTTEFSHSDSLADATEVAIESSESPEDDNNKSVELIRRTIRLEQPIDEKLEQLCRSERITRDTFLEAVYLVCSEKPKIRQEIIKIAKGRYQHRKRQGDKRKFVTMAKKYS